MDQVKTFDQLRSIIRQPSPVTEAKILDHLDDQALAFIALSPFVVLTTASADGRLEASPKGDAPGFIRVQSPTCILLPDRVGNNLAFGLQNILENPKVALLIMVPGTNETLRISGTAEILADPDVLNSMQEHGKPALLAIRIAIDRTFFHCGKAYMRSGLWKPETWPERQKVSFGKVISRQLKGGKEMKQTIDKRVEEVYAPYSEPNQ